MHTCSPHRRPRAPWLGMFAAVVLAAGCADAARNDSDAQAAAAEKRAAASRATERVAPADAGPQSRPLPGWYQWRGPEQNGVSREKNLPEKWDPDEEEN